MITKCLALIDEFQKEHSYRSIYRIYASHGDSPAVEYKLDGEIVRFSFRDQELVSEYCADRIKELLEGCPKGFVCFKLANCPEWFEIFWGILMAGYRPFLIDARHDKALTEYFIKESLAVAIISNDGNEYEGIRTVKAGDVVRLDKRHILEVAASADRTSRTYTERINSYEWGDEVALCTSGTTSTAKIFVYDCESMTSQFLTAREIITVNEYICNDEPKRNLCFLPLNHIFGFLANYLWYSFFGSTQIVPDKIAPSVLLSTCRDHKVTHILAVPLLVNNIAKGLLGKVSKQSRSKQFMFRRMIGLGLFAQRLGTSFGIKVSKALFKKSVLSQLAGTDVRCIICGGGHVLPESLRIINGIGYYTICGFGMTEVGISSMEKRPGIKYRLRGCVGVPVSSIEYKIVPFNDKDSSAGELVIRGSSIHSAMIKGGEHIPRELDAEGWFRTGDIGRLVDGALYIEGRLKEVIVNESGENVYPDELEDTFLNIDGVKNFTVLGIKKESNPLYEDIVIVCQVDETTFASEELIEALRQKIAERNGTLPVYKKLNYALVTKDDLPLSNGIKIRRVVIKREAEVGEGNFIKLEKLK